MIARSRFDGQTAIASGQNRFDGQTALDQTCKKAESAIGK